MAGFEIDGERFEVPMLSSLTLDESEFLYDVSGTLQEDFESADPDWDEEKRRAHVEANLKRFANPRFKRALAAIAYRRKHPEVTVEVAGTLAGSARNQEVTIAMILGPDEVDPTQRISSDSPTPPESESSRSELERTEHSGTSSDDSGTAPDTPPATTGTTDSDISSRGAHPIAQAS